MENNPEKDATQDLLQHMDDSFAELENSLKHAFNSDLDEWQEAITRKEPPFVWGKGRRRDGKRK